MILKEGGAHALKYTYWNVVSYRTASWFSRQFRSEYHHLSTLNSGGSNISQGTPTTKGDANPFDQFFSENCIKISKLWLLDPLLLNILQVRRTIRPYFVGTRWKPWYDVLTGISAWCAINYALGGFHLLHLKESHHFFTYVQNYLTNFFKFNAHLNLAVVGN